MTRLALLFAAVAAALALLISGTAAAEKAAGPSAEHGAAVEGAAAHGEGAAAAHGEGATGEHGGNPVADHGPGPINWFYGMVYASEGAEPSLIVRPKGMQPPLGALLLNTGILFWVVYRVGRRPISDALKKRRTTIMQGIDDAARMKSEAESRLAGYEDKLDHLGDEIERLKREMRAAGEAERVRILAEAKERRVRMEREAQLLIEQELKAARHELLEATVAAALSSASEQLAKSLTSADHQRLADEYLASVDEAVINAEGGRA
jgi:F-type H+-transporting ATPase subunit b